MTLVIDASAIVAAAMNEPNPALAELAFSALEQQQLIAPSLMPVEVASAIAKAEWTARAPTHVCDKSWMIALDFFPFVELSQTVDLARLLATCRTHSLRGADASYLMLATERQAALLTGDKALARAARSAGVPLLYDPNA